MNPSKDGLLSDLKQQYKGQYLVEDTVHFVLKSPVKVSCIVYLKTWVITFVDLEVYHCTGFSLKQFLILAILMESCVFFFKN